MAKDDDESQFSRHAVDSTGEPMEMMFSMRMPHDLRVLGGRKARLMGLSLSEYMRYLLARDVDADVDACSMGVEDARRVLQKRGGDGRP